MPKSACPVVAPGKLFAALKLSQNQCENLGIEPGTEPIGCGLFGCAYPKAGDKSRVIKVTRDSEDVAAVLKADKTGLIPKVFALQKLKLKDAPKPSPKKIREYQAARTAKGRPTKDFTSFLMREKKPAVFVLEVERVKPLTKEQKTFIAVNDYVDALKLPRAKFIKSSDKICKIEFTGQKVKKCKDFAKRIYTVKKGLLDVGVPWTDAHPNNWGITKDGRLVALDIGLTSLPLKKKLKVLAGLGMFSDH